MKPFPDPCALDLTYCMNIHAGETWAQQRQAVETHARAVRQRVASNLSFGLGLRLSAEAAQELTRQPERWTSFLQFCATEQLYVFTINGFPHGRFHGGRVKERVYQPDWTTDARVTYTKQLADLLAKALPEGGEGSISTVPGAYRAFVRDKATHQLIAARLMNGVAHCADIETYSGRLIHLGLEPEPACLLETSEESVAFFNEVILQNGREHLAKQRGISPDDAESLIRRHLGICVDTCHAALQFEQPTDVIRRLQDEGIRISKCQLSAALETDNNEDARRALRAYDEPVYLHQTRAQSVDGQVWAWNDLPDALQALSRQPLAETVRVHFHVPLYWTGTPPLRTTTHGLDTTFWSVLREGAAPHLEIETYTFDVLPPELKSADLTEHIVREYEWVLERL